MTPASNLNPDQEKAKRQTMAGVMLVLGACVFGGLLAVLLVAIGQREASAVVAVVVGIAIVAGVVIQVSGLNKLKALTRSDAK